MKIAVDKHSIDVVRNDGHEYIYLFDEEDINELLKTKLHCIYYNNCDYVDVNLTEYDVECRKKSKVTEPDFLEIPPVVILTGH